MKCDKYHVTMEPNPKTPGGFVCPADPLHVVKTWDAGYQPLPPVRDARAQE